MRAFRLVFVLALAAAALSSVACTNPMGPKPAGDTVASSSI
ncbi:MAG: hypothetical protein OEW77_03280 [Gemmatimonadota bacterium]|nr:hypothetical protein [Gemmatimonadota bacterium]